MEEKLAELLRDHVHSNLPEAEGMEIYPELDDPDSITYTDYDLDLRDYLTGIYGGKVEVTFHLRADDVSKSASAFGVKTDMELGIGLHTDEDTRVLFDNYMNNKPTKRMGIPDGHTLYYFDLEGNYGKSSRLLKEFEGNVSNREPAGHHNKLMYKSRMTPGDFELAGQALQMLINRLKPQESQDPEHSL